MGLLRWFTKNWANTIEPTHADLAPLSLPLPLAATIERIVAVVPRMRGWQCAERTTESVHLVRRTRLFRFADDIRLTFHQENGLTLVHAESRSRVGAGDLGQNRRNILELFALVRAAK
jgi:uncharacterized protein (DUF1499 family)